MTCGYAHQVAGDKEIVRTIKNSGSRPNSRELG